MSQDVNCSDAGASGTPTTRVLRFPLDGSRSSVSLVTTLTIESATGAAVDATDLYWVTTTAAWKAPLAGGGPTPVAGNLAPMTTPSPCGYGKNESNAIALDAKNVYIAAVAGSSDGNTGIIYRIPK